MRVLVACDKFKGALTATEANEAARRGLGEGVETRLCPIADGGEGFAETLVNAHGGVMVRTVACDPLGRVVPATYGMIRARGVLTAVIEMAAVSGMWRLLPGERNPLLASTFGTGELMRHAVEVSRAERLWIGLGGSATNDGGVGMAAALGVRFLDAGGNELAPRPEELATLAAVDESGRIALPEVLAACDVDNPLLGGRGATAVFGPQKGATLQDEALLESALGRLVAVSGGETWETFPGAGAAGGLGFGLLRFAGARLTPGFDLVATALGLAEAVEWADLVVTGEGCLDAQTAGGKGPSGVARLARGAGKPVVAFAGIVHPEGAALFDAAFALMPPGMSRDEAVARAAGLLEGEVRKVAGLLSALAGG